jgi:hypothetical protein
MHYLYATQEVLICFLFKNNSPQQQSSSADSGGKQKYLTVPTQQINAFEREFKPKKETKE